jgi:hypothetical protein
VKTIALGNTRGSWSISMRVNMLRRLARWQAECKRCILLYCGDHDVHGLRISTALRSNLADVLPAFRRTYPEWEDFDLDAVVIERFGLNADFIKVNRLSWTDYLVTGGGKDLGDPTHGIHWNRDVQAYIKKFGRKKVEADALVTRPQAGSVIGFGMWRTTSESSRDDSETRRRAASVRIDFIFEIAIQNSEGQIFRGKFGCTTSAARRHCVGAPSLATVLQTPA